MKKIIRMAIVCTLAGAALLTGCTKDYSQDISAVDKKVNDLQTMVNNLIASYEPRIGSLEAALPALQQTIEAGYKAADEALKQSFTAEANAIKESVANLQKNVTALSTDLANQKKALEDLEKAYKAGDEATLAAAKAAAEAGDAVLQKNIDAANANISSLQIQAALLEVAVAANTDAIIALQQSAKESAKALESLKAAVQALADQIQSLSVVPNNVTGLALASIATQTLKEADGVETTLDPVLSLTVDVEPAELAETVTPENSALRVVISDGVNPKSFDLPLAGVEAEDGFVTASSVLADYENLFGDAGTLEGPNFSVALVVKNANEVDGVDYGTYVASDYATASFASPANVVVEVVPGIYVEDDPEDVYYYGDFYEKFIEVPWNEYKSSTRKLFEGIQVGYICQVSCPLPGMVKENTFMTPEEVAEMFDKDAETLAPAPKAKCTVKSLPVVSGKKDFTAKEDGWNSTAAVNTTDIKTDANAKKLVNPTSKVVGELTFTVKKDNVTSTFPVEIDTYYTIVNKKGDVVTVDPVDFVWDYTQISGLVSGTKKEIGSSDAPKATAATGITIYDENGDVYPGTVTFLPFKTTTTTTASKLVDYKVEGVPYTDKDAVYQVEGVYTESNVDYPVTSSFTVSAMPEDPQEINLGEVEMAGSLSAAKAAAIAPLAKSFAGLEAQYIGATKNTKEDLYASLAKGVVVEGALNNVAGQNYTQTITTSNVVELIVNGEKATDPSEYIDNIVFSYYQKKKDGGFADKSVVNFKAGKAGYGNEFVLSFYVTAPWSITYIYKVVVKSKTLETALVPSGFIQDGVVTVGGAAGADGVYTINAIKMYSYMTLNAGEADPNDFTVELTYKTPAGKKFDKFASADDKKANAKAGCSGTPTGIDTEKTVYTFNEDGTIKEDTKDFTWAPYTGLKFTVTAQLMQGTNKVGEALVFDVVTPDPIQKIVWGNITDTRALNVASTVWLYQNVEVYGCLDATKDLVYWNPAVEGTVGYPWATTKMVPQGTDPETYKEVLDNPLGNRFYNQYFKFNYDPEDTPVKVYVNGVEQRASDIIEEITGSDYQLKIKSVSAAGVYTFEIPAELIYMKNFTQTGVVIVTIDFK